MKTSKVFYLIVQFKTLSYLSEQLPVAAFYYFPQLIEHKIKLGRLNHDLNSLKPKVAII